MEFYTDLGALPMDEWTTFQLTGDALDRLASAEEREDVGATSSNRRASSL